MTQQFNSDRPTWDEIRALRKPRNSSVWLPLDGEILDQIAELEKAIGLAERIDDQEHRTPEAPKLRVALEKLRDQAETAAVQFTFQEITRRQYRTIVEACPPTDPKWRWDEDLFAPLLIAATCVQPELTSVSRDAFLILLAQPETKVDELLAAAPGAVEIWDEWSEAAGYLLFAAAHEVTAQGTTVPFSVTATARTPGSGPNSTSASETAEPSDTTSS